MFIRDLCVQVFLLTSRSRITSHVVREADEPPSHGKNNVIMKSKISESTGQESAAEENLSPPPPQSAESYEMGLVENNNNITINMNGGRGRQKRSEVSDQTEIVVFFLQKIHKR